MIFLSSRSTTSFQSTRPQGARRNAISYLMQRRGFNPRARRGRDVVACPASAGLFCFNPRARRGRDVVLLRLLASRCCFNPRARRGRDRSCRFDAGLEPGFNPRARRGRDFVMA